MTLLSKSVMILVNMLLKNGKLHNINNYTAIKIIKQLISKILFKKIGNFVISLNYIKAALNYSSTNHLKR